MPPSTALEAALALVSSLAGKYDLKSIRPLLQAATNAQHQSSLSIAVLGRFKAGKSSFLNHLIGSEVLPVGVVPVTSVVTEIAYGALPGAVVRFENGTRLEIPLTHLGEYVAEAENPLNHKQVESVALSVPSLAPWRDLRFIDTPGLESAFAHNSEVSLGWAPQVDLALVAIGVDPPLSEHDLALIQTLFRYTPRLAVLLTKADLLEPAQLDEVLAYVARQLASRFHREIPIYPYSTRPGFAARKRALEEQFLAPAAADIATQRRGIAEQKVRTLLADCEQYLTLAWNAAQMVSSDRASLGVQLSLEEESLADMRLEMQLIARHATSGARSAVEKMLAPAEAPLQQKLLAAFADYAPHLPASLTRSLDAFSDWLRNQLKTELAALSGQRRAELVAPLSDVQRRYQRALQNFRDRLAEKTLHLFGVALKTTEPGIAPEPPQSPDVKIGRMFDRNWELLSPLLPMGLLRGPVLARYRRKIADETTKNLSRLTTQWEEIIAASVRSLERQAQQRLLDLLSTVRSLLQSRADSVPSIARDLEQLRAFSKDGNPRLLE